ncbi:MULTISPECIES: 3D domain-containing protein [Clostridium]|uniref:3D domain-containing protein n=1 Tax=Clostridium lapidicellarium TaxID=3240931 RepID=A0ABV4E1K5_9CLOT
MNKRTLSVIMSLTLVLVTCGNVFAVSSTTSELQQTQNDKRQLESKVGDLNSQINGVIQKIDENKKDMNRIANNIKNTQAKLQTAKNNSQLQRDLFKKRVRAMYVNGTSGYLEIILSSKDFSDFLSRIDTITKVIKFDNGVIAKLKKNELAIEQEKKNLNDENIKLQSLKTSNETILSKLNSNIREQKSLLASTTVKEQKLLAAQSEQAAAARASHSTTVAMAGKQALSRGSTGSAPSSSSKVLTMQATAYCDNGYTATGVPTRRNSGGYSTIAVDPRVIPLGSRVYVQGYGYAIAADTGGAINGNIIDLYVPTQAEAESWGRRTVTVYVLN